MLQALRDAGLKPLQRSLVSQRWAKVLLALDQRWHLHGPQDSTRRWFPGFANVALLSGPAHAHVQPLGKDRNRAMAPQVVGTPRLVCGPRRG